MYEGVSIRALFHYHRRRGNPLFCRSSSRITPLIPVLHTPSSSVQDAFSLPSWNGHQQPDYGVANWLEDVTYSIHSKYLLIDHCKASIRYQLDHVHTYDFVEGTLPTPLAPELQQFFPTDDAYFNYFESDSVNSMRKALENLRMFLKLEGPYDGVIAFSQGACLVATYLIQQRLLNPQEPLPFKCAVFFSGGIPLDPLALELGLVQQLSKADRDRCLMAGLPIAHIWGRNDTLWPGTSEVLYALSDPQLSSVCLHDEGHTIPAARSKDAISEAVKVIRRTVDRASIVL